MATLKLIETSVTEEFVTLRLADETDEDEATESVEFEVPLDVLKLPTASGEVPLGDARKRYLASIQVAALCYMRDALNEVARDLQEVTGR